MGRRLFVGRLPLDTSERELKDIFGDVGEVSHVSIKFDRDTGEQRGFAFVTMASDDGAENAIRALNGHPLRGRNIRVVEAQRKPKGGARPTVDTVDKLDELSQEDSDVGAAPIVTGGDSGTGPSATPTIDGLISEANGAFVNVPVDVLREITRERGAVPVSPELLAEITREAAAVQVSAARRRWLATTAAVLVALIGGFFVWSVFESPPPSDPNAVLVAPMEVHGELTDDYLGYAFSQAIAVNLVSFGQLRVLPVPSRAEVEPGQEIAAAIRGGAGRLIVGSLTREGDGVQVTLSLVELPTKRVLWGTQSDSPGGDVRRLSTTLARSIAEKLEVSTPRQYAHPTTLSGREGMAALAETTEAGAALQRGDFKSALSSTARLVELFPTQLDAWVLRTHALMLAWDADETPQKLRAFRASLAKATGIDGVNPYSAYYRAYIALREGKYNDAIERFTAVLDREDLAPATRAWILRYRASGYQQLNRTQQALVDLNESQRLDPTNAWTYNILSAALEQSGQFEEALTRARQGTALNPSYWRNHQALGLAYSRLERFDEAVEALTRACEISAAQVPCALVAINLIKAGNSAEAATAASHARSLTPTVWGNYNLACFAALSGDSAGSLEYLRASVDQGLSDPFVAEDEDLASLAGNADFVSLVQTVKGRYARAGGR